MMKKILFIFCLILITGQSLVTAQTVAASEGKQLLEAAPKEKIYVHFNSSLLFPGEYLYYKLYNLKAATNIPSSISKIGYVELVGEDGEQVFQHLVPLDQGQGHGDFFIPTTLPSGSYKLLAYTNWMRNSKDHFEADLVVINPYRGDQSSVTPQGEIQDSTAFFVAPAQIASNTGTKGSPAIGLTTDKQIYHQRERVILNIANSGAGLYSLSVRRIDSIRKPEKPGPEVHDKEAEQSIPETEIYLPEFRGDLVSGKIIPLSQTENRSLANVKVAFSVPGEQLLYKVATTNENGEFYLSFDEPRARPEIIVQIIGENKKYFKFELENLPPMDYSGLDFVDFNIIPSMESWILKRSVQNQIENAYYNQKPDTVVTAKVTEPFYVQKPELYILDAYNRFQTIKETFVEIIKYAWISKNGNGDEMIEVREPNGGENYGLPALLLVDGVMVQDHANFISYPAKNVESIGILRDNYFIGSHIFEGIIDVKTFNGKYWEENPEEYRLQKDIKVPELQKRYFQQNYSDSTQQYTSTLPDLRTQLLWEPEFDQTEEKEAEIEFFTSDVPGYYEIELSGFTSKGKPVSIRAYFRVEE